MGDRPLIFSAPMVKALLDVRKTQTRRLLRTQPIPDRRPTHFVPVGRCLRTGRQWWEAHDQKGPMGGVFPGPPGCLETHAYTPHPGDRLWVREAWRPGYDAEGFREDLGRVAQPADFDPATTAIEYLADGTCELGGRDRPAMYLPRWASRLTLVVTDVRVQRLQDISEEDALAEGVDHFAESLDRPRSWEGLSAADRAGMTQVIYGSARRGFQHLWEHLHGADAWSANPWICAVSFETHRANIDALSAAGAEREPANA